jgi:PAS domain S-box-containing protein
MSEQLMQLPSEAQRALHLFLRYIIGVGLLTSFVSALLTIYNLYMPGLLGVIDLLTATLLWVFARRYIDTGNLARTVELTSAGILLVCLYSVLHAPYSVIIATLGSLIAAVLALTYLKGRHLLITIGMAWASAIAFWLIAKNAGAVSEPNGFAYLIIFGNSVLIYGAIVVLLWQWRNRLEHQVQQAERANRELREVRANLEATVTTRTAALSQALTRYQVASELTSDYTYSVTIHPDGVLTTDWATDAMVHITGYRPEELDAMGSLRGIVYPEDMPLANGRLKRIMEGKSDTTELRIIRRDGAIRWLRAHARPIWDPVAQRVTQVYGAMADITERRQAEEEHLQLERNMREAQRLESLGILAGGIAHDFNNLLLGVMGSASLARMELPAESAVHEHLGQIELAAQRAADLTKQMLAYAGRGRFDVKTVLLNDIVREMTRLLHSSISKQIELCFNLDPTLPATRVDVTQIRQVIMNLLVNAAEAIGDKAGMIILRTATIDVDATFFKEAPLIGDLPSGRYVTLTVIDTGVGIERDMLQRIFDPFFSTKTTGRGLGLAAVLGIARSHGGTIKVESTVGQGSSFTLVLPISVEVVEPPVQPIVREPMTNVLEDRVWTILVVDDEAEVRAVTTRILQRAGYEVLSLPSGQAAIDLVRERPDHIHGVLIDMTMVGMSGLETFYALQEYAPDIPVALMSGYSEDDALQHFTRTRPHAFLQKPFSAADLQQLMAQLIRER